MKSTIICAIIMIVSLLFVGHFSVTIKPFSISFPYWHRAVGMLLIIIAIVVYNVGERADGYRKGLNDGWDIGHKQTLKYINDKCNEIDKLKEQSNGDGGIGICHICGKETEWVCEKCDNYYCEECSAEYNVFTQIDYNCCEKCANIID